MNWKKGVFCSVSATAMMVSGQARAQTPPPAQPTQLPTEPDDQEIQEIIVTGMRQSLREAAKIKRDAPQVVDAIVADDIGKFPDPTTAAALQRIPGIQVTVGANNEIVNPIIRGLGDILTTLDGREIFSGVGRGFAFQDLPAEALAGVDVYKSNSADLIEGGVAGVINLKLNKAFDFEKFTISANARANYTLYTEEVSPAFGILITDRWDTGIGEVGALLNVSYNDTKFNRPIAFNCERRSTNNGPPGAPNIASPTCQGGLNEFGSYQRPQANASLQWQASPEIEIYADGLYAGYRSKFSTGFILNDLFSARSISGAVADDNCFDARVNRAGFRANSIDIANGNFTNQSLCNLESATFNNFRTFTSNQARDFKTDGYLGASGVRYESGPAKLVADLSYQKSIVNNQTFIIDVGKTLPTGTLTTNVDNATQFDTPDNPIGDPDGFAFTNGLFQDFSRADSKAYAAKIDGSYEFDSFIKTAQVGLRFADRDAVFQQFVGGPRAPGGSYATLLNSVDLPGDFLMPTPGIPQINGGSSFLVPNRDYLSSDAGQANLRRIFGVSPDRPAFDPTRRFAASEKTYSSYAQAGYELLLGGITIDGLAGVRVTKTDRTITGTGFVNRVPVTTTRDASDTDLLPNFSARARLGGGLQARFTYAKTLARPAFGSLNPGLNFIISTNPNVVNSGSGGNPDLRPQKSNSFDATLEYYFPSGFFAVVAYYRDITDRVFTNVAAEVIDGQTYNIARPRNVGAATLKGVEVSGQTFFDFLPGVFSGLGAFGNFTYADSKVNTEDDPLVGFPLQGVSKYNFNAGLLYDKFGLSGRLVYTYRGKYFDQDRTAAPDLRPADQKIFLNRVRPNGRLDFSLGYDVSKSLTISVDGTNITRAKYQSYYDIPLNPRDVRNDDSIYSVGIRARI